MSSLKRNALGRGLSALLEDNDTVAVHKEQTEEKPKTLSLFQLIPLEEISANPFQPRNNFEETALNELADSIKVQGIIQPITVRRLDANNYQLISGERRLKASKLAGLSSIPAYIRTADDQQMIEMALIENIQRENLNPLEVAFSFQRMIEECNLRQEDLGERVGKNRSTVTNYLRLLKLPPAIQAALRDENISMGHAKALLGVDSVDSQIYVYREILSKELSVRKTEDLVRAISAPSKEAKEKKPIKNESHYRKIEEQLASRLSSKIELKADGAGKGKIIIPFLSDDDLNRILEMMDW